MPAPSGLIEAYLEGPAILRRSLADFSAEQLRARPVPGKWSTLEVVCHLVDSEQAWCHRMKRVIAESKPPWSATTKAGSWTLWPVTTGTSKRN